MMNLIRFYLQLLVRRAPVLIAIVVLFTGFGLGFALNQPDRYSASAKLLVESPQISEDLAASTVRTEDTEQLAVIRERLQTRATLIDIANKLDVFPPNENGQRPSPNAMVQAMRSSLTIRTTAGRRQASYIDIGFESADPNIAAAVVNEMVTRALDDDVRLRTARAGDTLEFFEQEVDRLSSELSRQSGRISQFKADNSNSLPEALDFRLSRESALSERLANLKREEANLQEQRDRVEAVYAETGRLRTPETQLTPEERQLRTLETELANALAIYSENNPRVTVLKTRIEQLTKVVAGQIAEDGETINPSSSVYDVTIAEIEAQAKSLSVEVADVNAELAKLREHIEQTPQTAIALEALQRDYSNIQLQYNAAVNSLARAKTGEQIELAAKGSRMSLVESAVPPQNPSGPNRKVITAAGGLAGVAIAAGLFALLELLNSSIRRPAELVNRVGITPFATLPNIQTIREKRIARIRRVAAVLFVVVVLPASLYFMDQHVMSLGEVVQTLRRFI